MANQLKTSLVIEADTQGGDKIGKLAEEMERLAAEGGDAAPKFKLLAAELRGLGQQQELVDRFKALKAETTAYAGAATQAQQATRTAALAMKDKQAALAQAVAAEKNLAAQLEAARTQQAQMGQAVQAARQEIKALGQAGRQAGADTAMLKERLQDARAQLKVNQSAWREAGQQVKQLAASQHEAAQAVRAADAAAGQSQKAFEAQRKSAAEAARGYASSRTALQRLRDEMTQSGLSGRNLAQAQTQVNRGFAQTSTRAGELRVVYQKLGGTAQQAGAAQARAQQAAAESVRATGEELGKLRGYYLGLKSLLAGSHALKGMLETADAMSNLQARMKLVTGEGELFEDMWRRTSEVAQRTSSDLEATGELFSRIATAGKDAGLSTQQAAEQSLALTQTINQAVQLSGASAEASKAAITQLIQGLQSGVLRGDEFNSVMEQAPRLARAMADGLGVTTGQLRALAQDGKLSSETVIKALQSQAKAIEQEFGKLPPTVGRSLQNLSTAWGLFVDQTNQTWRGTERLARAIDLLAQNLDTVAGVAMKAGYLLAGVVTARAMTALFAYGRATLAAASGLGAMGQAARATGAEVTAAGNAMQRFGTALRSVAYAAAIDQLAQLAMAHAKLSEVQRRQAEGQQLANRLQEQTAERLRELSERTGVVVRNMQEFDEAVRSGALVANQATGAWESAAQAQARLANAAQTARQAAEDLAGAQAVQVVEAFHAVAEGADKAEKSVKALAESLKYDSAEGIAGFARGLEALHNTGALTARQLADAWRQALGRLDDGQLEQLRAKLAAAGEQGMLSAEQLARAHDQVLAAAFARTGVNAAQAMGRISEGAQQAIDGIELLAGSIEDAGLSAEQSGRALEMALSAAVPKADSLEAVQALEDRLKKLHEAGLIGAEGLARVQQALEQQRRAIEAQLPGIQSLDEALRQLGVRPQAELQKLADNAHKAFEAVQKSGKASTRELAEAWRAMAEAQIAANNGVADAALQSQAAQHGMVIEMDKAGRAVVKTMEQATRETLALGRAARQAGRDAREGAKEAAAGADEAAQAHTRAVRVIQGSWLSAAAQASQYRNEATAYAWDVAGALQYLGRRAAASWEQIMGAQRYTMKLLTHHADEYVRAMQRVDEQQQLLERRTSGAAKGVEDLRLRLLELNGTEEQIAQARSQRERQELEQQIQLLQLEAERARLKRDTAAERRHQEDLALLREQLALLDQISAAESRQRQQQAQERARQERERAEAEAQRLAQQQAQQQQAQPQTPTRATAPGNLTINLTANGISDPVRLAKLIEPELAKLQRLAR